jgi:hypothetical protein
MFELSFFIFLKLLIMTAFTDNTLVNLQEEYKNRQIQEVLDELERDLVGLKPVKDRIKEIAALFRKQKKINEKASVKYDLPKKFFSTGDYASTGYYEYFR